MRREGVRAWCSYPLLALSVIGATLALRAPVLRTGFIVDDYAQVSMLTGAFPVKRTPLELFTFSNGSAEDIAALRDFGYLPWWSHAALRVSLFRPLSSALMWCDLHVFGLNAFAFHLHSACWWLAMMTVLAAVLRQLLPPLPALLALTLCAAHPGHIMFLGWLANRNAMVATTLALAGLWGQLAGRGAARGPPRALIMLAYTLSLCASEYALGFLPYAVLCDVERSGTRSVRLRRLIPWLLLLFAYGVLRVLGGFGARGSGMYVDPIAEPLSFLRAAFVRFPVLVGDLVLAVRSTWWSAGFPWAPQLAAQGWLPAAWAVDLRPLRSVQVAVGLVALPILAGFVARSLGRRLSEPAPCPHFLALGLPLSLVPALSAFPESRLLLPGLFAWSVLLVDAGRAAWPIVRNDRGMLRARFAFGSVVVLWLLGVVLPPLYSMSENQAMAPLANAVRASILAPALDGALERSRHVLLIAAVDPTTTIYIPLVRRVHGRPAPSSCQLLMSTTSTLRLSRLASNSIVVERLEDAYSAADAYASALNEMPLTSGQRFVSDGMRVTVERVLDGRPMRARFELDTSFDDPGVVLLMQTVFGLMLVTPPRVGDSISVGPAVPPFALMGAGVWARARGCSDTRSCRTHTRQ